MAMLNRQIATSLASVLLFEDEVRRSKEVAEMATLQREQISRQLQLQTGRMRRMTELSPMGMFLFDPDGLLLEANDKYYEMTGVSSPGDKLRWSIDMMVGDSQEAAKELWEYTGHPYANVLFYANAVCQYLDMITHHKPASRELQFANSECQPRDIDGAQIEYWVLAASQPEISPHGKLISIMGSITDISHLKWAQGLQERRLHEAEQVKRQQNDFIDITSHEMRSSNPTSTGCETYTDFISKSIDPLSAILICADGIRETLIQYKFSCSSDRKMAKDCIEAADNIALCVQHQKSIVDDILTVSKLDLNLLRITPIPAQPIIVVQESMAMLVASNSDIYGTSTLTFHC
jgi:PAS domain-containing protein